MSCLQSMSVWYGARLPKLTWIVRAPWKGAVTQRVRTPPGNLSLRRRQDVCLRHGAVDAHALARLYAVVARRAQQAPVDPLPGLGAHRADRGLQRRLLRWPDGVRARESARRGRVAQGELQAPPGLLAQVLEDRAAQHRLAVETSTATGRGTEIGSDRVKQFRVGVEPGGDRLKGVGDGMVNGCGVE